MNKYETIGLSKPVNITAALISQEGEHYKIKKDPNKYSSKNPIEVIEFTGQPDANMKGLRFNKFFVVGYLGCRNGTASSRGSWLVKCDCGTYENRSRKALLKKHEDNTNQCASCDDISHLRSGNHLLTKKEL